MARIGRVRRRLLSRQLKPTRYHTRSYDREEGYIKEGILKKIPFVLQKKDWEDATCSVCMEFPHNAVLLLCSSYDNGCRPYMCGTSYRHSNCLDQFQKAYTKAITSPDQGNNNHFDANDPTCEKMEMLDLSCPLCRGHVKGFTVVKPAREYHNKKKRSCMQDNCTFVGTYKELHRHVKTDHPCMKPREVDPSLEQKWRALVLESEQQDVISTIRSSMPHAVVFGDYVLEMNGGDTDMDDEDSGGDVDFIGGRGIGRRLLYLFLQDLVSFRRDRGVSESRSRVGAGPIPFVDGGEDNALPEFIRISSDTEGGAVRASVGRDGVQIRGGRRQRHRRRQGRDIDSTFGT